MIDVSVSVFHDGPASQDSAPLAPPPEFVAWWDDATLADEGTNPLMGWFL